MGRGALNIQIHTQGMNYLWHTKSKSWPVSGPGQSANAPILQMRNTEAKGVAINPSKYAWGRGIQKQNWSLRGRTICLLHPTNLLPPLPTPTPTQRDLLQVQISIYVNTYQGLLTVLFIFLLLLLLLQITPIYPPARSYTAFGRMDLNLLLPGRFDMLA